MKRLILLLGILLVSCTGCTALPAEERAFAVALCLEQGEAGWQVHGRIPTYQSGGGYLTVSGKGDSLPAALADMEAAAPMHLHLSQLRLIVADEKLGRSDALMQALQTLADRSDMRLHCAVAVTADPIEAVAEALKPSTGARLSKMIDVQLETRIQQGTLLPATLADVIRMEDRQSPVLMALTLEKDGILLEGGYPLTAADRLTSRLSPEETALLSLLTGQADTLRLTLPGGVAQVRDVSARVRLGEERRSASVTLRLRMPEGSMSAEVLETALADRCLALLERLSAQGSDVLGLGRKAIMGTKDADAWRESGWHADFPALRWSVSVQVQGAT